MNAKIRPWVTALGRSLYCTAGGLAMCGMAVILCVFLITERTFHSGSAF